MADEEKDTPTTQPNTPNPVAAQKADSAASANVAVADDDTPEEVVAAHQALIKAEQAVAQQQLKSQETLAKAQENFDKARARAAGAAVDDDSDFPGFHHKTWAGHDCLQCAFCSWDVVTSSMYDLNARMNEHLAAAHPNWRMLKILFDEAGNFIGDEVE